MAQMTEHFKAPEKIQLSNEEIANLSEAQFKTLVIRMLTEMTELSHKMKEEMKAKQSEIKGYIQGTSSDRLKSMIGPEGRKKHSTRNKNFKK